MAGVGRSEKFTTVRLTSARLAAVARALSLSEARRRTESLAVVLGLRNQPDKDEIYKPMHNPAPTAYISQVSQITYG
jgi:hypothetical protein